MNSEKGSEDATARELREFYNTSTAYRNNLAKKSQNEYWHYIELVRSHIPSHEMILEVGCGVGTASSMFAEAGYRIVGTDISPLFLREATGKSNKLPNTIGFTACDTTALPFADDSFGAVVSNETIEHLIDVAAALDEMARIIKIGGFIVCRLPSLSTPIWPLIDLPNLLTGKGGRPPHYGSIVEASAFFLTNLARTARIALAKEPRFEKREPQLSMASNAVGGDTDAAYWSSVIELSRYLSKRGFKVVNQVQSGPKYSRSWWVARTAPWLSPAIALVAQRVN
jgi:ubiquinone/menaquinone biosynthesis C-methylase UbiE